MDNLTFGTISVQSILRLKSNCNLSRNIEDIMRLLYILYLRHIFFKDKIFIKAFLKLYKN